MKLYELGALLQQYTKFVMHLEYFDIINHKIEQNGMHLNQDFYVVVGKQCCTENVY